MAELRGIDVTTDTSAGRSTTYTKFSTTPLFNANFRYSAGGRLETGSVATQNRGTIGGNIANASPAADSPPALLVYDAEIELVSSAGARWAPYREFHTGYKKMQLDAKN